MDKREATKQLCVFLTYTFKIGLGRPVVKNPPSNAGDAGSIPGQELRSHMSQGN